MQDHERLQPCAIRCTEEAGQLEGSLSARMVSKKYFPFSLPIVDLHLGLAGTMLQRFELPLKQNVSNGILAMVRGGTHTVIDTSFWKTAILNRCSKVAAAFSPKEATVRHGHVHPSFSGSNTSI